MHDCVCKQVPHYTTPPSTNSVIQVQKPAVIKALSKVFNLSRPATLPSRLLLCMLAVVHSMKPFSTHHSLTKLPGLVMLFPFGQEVSITKLLLIFIRYAPIQPIGVEG